MNIYANGTIMKCFIAFFFAQAVFDTTIQVIYHFIVKSPGYPARLVNTFYAFQCLSNLAWAGLETTILVTFSKFSNRLDDETVRAVTSTLAET